MNQITSVQPRQLVSFVDSLMVPIKEATLLLPVSAVSEVVEKLPVSAVESGHQWYLGTIQWREQDIPLVCYEALIGGELQSLTENARIAILKASGEKTKFGFYGVVTQGYPRSVRITPTSDFRPQGDEALDAGVLMYATLDDNGVVMPDLAYIEKQLSQ